MSDHIKMSENHTDAQEIPSPVLWIEYALVIIIVVFIVFAILTLIGSPTGNIVPTRNPADYF